MYYYDLPGIGDYEEPDYEEPEPTAGGIPESWYAFNEDRSPGWDESEEW